MHCLQMNSYSVSPFWVSGVYKNSDHLMWWTAPTIGIRCAKLVSF